MDSNKTEWQNAAKFLLEAFAEEDSAVYVFACRKDVVNYMIKVMGDRKVHFSQFGIEDNPLGEITQYNAANQMHAWRSLDRVFMSVIEANTLEE